MNESGCALVFGTEAKTTADALGGFVGIENELHAARVAAATSEAGICGIQLGHVLSDESF
jgi:hypothetical protein